MIADSRFPICDWVGLLIAYALCVCFLALMMVFNFPLLLLWLWLNDEVKP